MNINVDHVNKYKMNVNVWKPNPYAYIKIINANQYCAILLSIHNHATRLRDANGARFYNIVLSPVNRQ